MKKSNKIINLFAACAIALASTIGLAAPVHAVTDICSLDVDPEVKAAAGCSTGEEELPVVIRNILIAIIGVMGLVAVIFVIIGGVQYMTSSGDAAKMQRAKSTILYACIGLAICALAFAIVNFAIGIIN